MAWLELQGSIAGQASPRGQGVYLCEFVYRLYSVCIVLNSWMVFVKHLHTIRIVVGFGMVHVEYIGA